MGNSNCSLLLDSGSVCSILNLSLAMQTIYNCENAKWSEKKINELRIFSNEIVDSLGCLKAPDKHNDWTIKKRTCRSSRRPSYGSQKRPFQSTWNFHHTIVIIT